MNQEYEKLLHCLDCVREKTDFVPKVAIEIGRASCRERV